MATNEERTLQWVNPSTEWLIATADLGAASRLASKLNLALNVWRWVPTAHPRLGVRAFRLVDEDMVQALMPPRPWESEQ